MVDDTLPKVLHLDRDDWVEDYVPKRRVWLYEQLLIHGALLIRGLGVAGHRDFAQLTSWFIQEPIQYTDRVTPRTALSGSVYTSTEAPSHFTIRQHSEATFSSTWPGRLAFTCIRCPDSGGQTPLCDNRVIFGTIPTHIKDEFRAKGVCYVRNFGKGPGMGWRQAFQVDEPKELEAYCRESDIKLCWKEGNAVQTRQTRPALAAHPETGEPVWFNHSNVLHIDALAQPLRDMVKKQFAEDDYPQNVYFGDGTRIPDDYISTISECVERSVRTFEWHQGDLLLLDNMLIAHGRTPYAGKREVLVSMGAARDWDTITVPDVD